MSTTVEFDETVSIKDVEESDDDDDDDEIARIFKEQTLEDILSRYTTDAPDDPFDCQHDNGHRMLITTDARFARVARRCFLSEQARAACDIACERDADKTRSESLWRCNGTPYPRRRATRAS